MIARVLTNLSRSRRRSPGENRSLLFRDPEGNLINLFTPISPETIRKFNAQAGTE
jgi:hypothetical protein